MFSMQGAQVGSLIGELRSHLPSGATKKYIYMHVNYLLPFGIRARKEIITRETPVDKVRGEICQERRQLKDKNKQLWASLVAQR